MKLTILFISILALGCGQTSNEQKVEKVAGNADSAIPVASFAQAQTGSQNQLNATGSMHNARAAHTSTLLPNGKVLICGGFAGTNYLSSAELYDPATNTFKQLGNMTTPRVSHSATLLPDGKVLIAGGYDGSYLSSAEIFDPVSETFTAINQLKINRMGHTATLLNNGKILLAGGVGTGWSFLQSAEVFDIATQTFAITGSMGSARESHTATLLTNGMVLITGGHKDRRSNITIFSSAEIYDPATAEFKVTGNMNVKRHKHDALLLSNGKVLITGGSDHRDGDGKYTSTEMYDLESGTFIPAPNMNLARFKHSGTSVLLSNGDVLIAGGNTRAEIFNVGKNRFEIVEGNMGSERLFSTALLMQNGKVLISGGYDENLTPSNNAWIFSATNE
jgi:WD40 repeat protein